MPYYEVMWNPEPGGNVEHIAEHHLTPDDVVLGAASHSHFHASRTWDTAVVWDCEARGVGRAGLGNSILTSRWRETQKPLHIK